jgi:cytochrome P450
MMNSDQRQYDPISFKSLDFWGQPAQAKWDAFRTLRNERPITWQQRSEPVLTDGAETQGGYWALVKHAHVRRASRDQETFCSRFGTASDDFPIEFQQRLGSFIVMDDPEHAKLRKIVASAFTPKQVAKSGEELKVRSKEIVDDLLDHGPGDFVNLVSDRLPMITICDMMGVPESLREQLVIGSHAILGRADPAWYQGMSPMESADKALEMMEDVAAQMIVERRKRPTDDLMSALVHAEVDGERLSPEDLTRTFNLLVGAGNDTTRNTTSHTMKSLCDNPDQRAWLLEDFEGRKRTAVEEFLRYASAVTSFRRTLTRDIDFEGTHMAEGESVILYYVSGNHDEEVFEKPDKFDLSRWPNDHVTFGGGGVHHCLGAPLSRLQLGAIFGELLQRVPDLEVGDPEYLLSFDLNGVVSLPCTFTTKHGAKTSVSA